MIVIYHEYSLHGAAKIRNSKIRGAGEADHDIVERGGHANEVYEPKDRTIRAMQSDGVQLWRTKGAGSLTPRVEVLPHCSSPVPAGSDAVGGSPRTSQSDDGGRWVWQKAPDVEL